MVSPLQFSASGFNRAVRTQLKGQTSLALVRSAGRGLNLNKSGLSLLLQPAVSSSTNSLDALRASQAIDDQLQGSEGTDLLRRLAPQLVAQQTVSRLVTGGGFTLSEQSNLISASLDSLSSRGSFLSVKA